MEAYVQLTGNVGGTVDFHKNTVPIANFRLAHTPRVLRNGEWKDAATTWITVSCYRTLAENVAVSLVRGQPVLVAGRLRTHVWEKEGITYERLTLEATAVGHDLSRGTATFARGRVAPAAADRAEQDRADQDRAEQDRTEQDRTEEDRDEGVGAMPDAPTDRLAERDRLDRELAAWGHS